MLSVLVFICIMRPFNCKVFESRLSTTFQILLWCGLKLTTLDVGYQKIKFSDSSSMNIFEKRCRFTLVCYPRYKLPAPVDVCLANLHV